MTHLKVKIHGLVYQKIVMLFTSVIT